MTVTCLLRIEVELPDRLSFLRGGSSRNAGGERRRDVQGMSSYYDAIPCCSHRIGVSAESRREEGRTTTRHEEERYQSGLSRGDEGYLFGFLC